MIPSSAPLATAVLVLACAFLPGAAIANDPFVAPGLWRIVSDVHGPMNQHALISSEACWDARSGFVAYPHNYQIDTDKGAPINGTQSVRNTGNTSTVHLHDTVASPQGAITQDIVQVYSTTRSVQHRATMTGHGSLTVAGAPILDESFTQHGRWLATVCPGILPAAHTQMLAPARIPALDALQKLAQKLQAEDGAGKHP
jgi:hypothetical protein